MSVVPMRLLTLAGPLAQFDPVVHACVLDQPFHPVEALPLMEGMDGVSAFPSHNPYEPLLRRTEAAAGRLGVALAYAPFPPYQELQPIEDYLADLEARIQALDARRAEQDRSLRDSREIAAQLQGLRGLSAGLEDLFRLEYARFRFGSLPKETYERFRDALDRENHLFFLPTHTTQGRVHGVYFTTRAARQRADRLMASLHFSRTHIDAPLQGTAEQAQAALAARIQGTEQALQALEEERAALGQAEGDKLLSVRAWLRFQCETHGLRRYAAHSQESFYLMGWTPEPALEELGKKLSAFPDLSWTADRAEAAPQLQPPTVLKNNFFGRAFQPFLELYGLPSYRELDPSLFLAVTYCTFFGIMFGDVGQGLCLALAGLLLARRRGGWLGNILTCCGLSSALFGCLYGSVFGNEELLEGFHVLEGDNVFTLLLLSLALGAAMLCLAMVFNICNGLRQRSLEKLLFSPNGLAGLSFYLGLLLLILGEGTGLARLATPAYVLPALILPLILILFRRPLALFLARDPAWHGIRLGETLGVGLFELFETLLSYLTNSLSFLRVGAYAVTHVGLMLVVRLLSGGGNPLVLALGNLFVIGFEGLLVGIQALRLEFYELFGRFYQDGGLPFQPRRIDYSAPMDT